MIWSCFRDFEISDNAVSQLHAVCYLPMWEVPRTAKTLIHAFQEHYKVALPQTHPILICARSRLLARATNNRTTIQHAHAGPTGATYHDFGEPVLHMQVAAQRRRRTYQVCVETESCLALERSNMISVGTPLKVFKAE